MTLSTGGAAYRSEHRLLGFKRCLVGLFSGVRKMWTYVQKTGELLLDGVHEAFGYSGYDDPETGQNGKNNPDLQTVRDVGPIPTGRYTIQSPEDTVNHGPFVLPLIPSPDNQMFGRRSVRKIDLHGSARVRRHGRALPVIR